MDNGTDWRRLKALVLDSVSSPITKRVYNLGLDEFFARYGQEPRRGLTKTTVAAWRASLEDYLSERYDRRPLPRQLRRQSRDRPWSTLKLD